MNPAPGEEKRHRERVRIKLPPPEEKEEGEGKEFFLLTFSHFPAEQRSLFFFFFAHPPSKVSLRRRRRLGRRRRRSNCPLPFLDLYVCACVHVSPPPPSSAAAEGGGEKRSGNCNFTLFLRRSVIPDLAKETAAPPSSLPSFSAIGRGGVFFFLFRLCVLYPSPEIIQICRLAPKKIPPRGGPSPPLSYVHTGLQGGGGIEQERFRVGRKENEEGRKSLELLPPLPPSIPTCHQRKRRRVTKVDPGGRLLRTVCTETSPHPKKYYILFPRFLPHDTFNLFVHAEQR